MTPKAQADATFPMIETGEATAILPTESTAPIKVIGTQAIRATFDDLCLQQAINSRTAPGVTEVVLNPDAHCGYGAPVGCVMVSPTHIYPGPVGVDIKCSMSLLQMDVPSDAVEDRQTRRALIAAMTGGTVDLEPVMSPIELVLRGTTGPVSKR